MENNRVLVWYSDGAASAVAAKLAVEKYGDRCQVIKCDTTSTEHPDNLRFRQDVERWIERKIILIRSTKFKDIDEVFKKTRYMSGVKGARCTVELKKVPRFEYQLGDDVHIFGFTADEGRRIKKFKKLNPELRIDSILQDAFIRKQDCYQMLVEAGIRIPAMYRLGFDHNNCIGCVKAASPGYWNKVRKHFPGVFKRRARQSRELGVKLTRVKGVRMFLDELPPDVGLKHPKLKLGDSLYSL